ncbi:hypothetical protein [Paenibacillus sp. 1-18]|uniref:hypothetical protein n=1 Tax=Paenibacillus sp. 1-18 TaxID=1333846 RepID=UPI000470E093|nr:hypothetical protein [Paenibacillus sp. 1-18]
MTDKLINEIKTRITALPKTKVGLGGYHTGQNDAYDNILSVIEHLYPDLLQQPDIQPGDRVDYIGIQFPFLKNVKVDHIEIHRVGRVAALAYDDEIYKVYVDQVKKVDIP